jgi:hypothetical protein
MRATIRVAFRGGPLDGREVEYERNTDSIAAGDGEHSPIGTYSPPAYASYLWASYEFLSCVVG